MNRLRMEHRANLSAAEPEIERIEVRRKKLIEMVMDGVPPAEVKDEMIAKGTVRRPTSLLDERRLFEEAKGAVWHAGAGLSAA